jgi:hypothetical protein
MQPSIENSDFNILREFEATVSSLRYRNADFQMQAEMLKLGSPFLDRLKKNGHSFPEAIALMREVFKHQPGKKVNPTPIPGVYKS